MNSFKSYISEATTKSERAKAKKLRAQVASGQLPKSEYDKHMKNNRAIRRKKTMGGVLTRIKEMSHKDLSPKYRGTSTGELNTRIRDNRKYSPTERNAMRAEVQARSQVREAKSMDGDTIKVGQDVGFKDGYEQYGKVKSIRGNNITITVYDSVTGKSENRPISANRLWVESTQLDELSNNTMRSYAKKAEKDAERKDTEGVKAHNATRAYADKHGGLAGVKKHQNKLFAKSAQRQKSRSKALHKIYKNQASNEGTVNELSKNTLGSYIKKSKNDLSISSHRQGLKKGRDAEGDQKNSEKRRKGIDNAVNRLTKEETISELYYLQPDGSWKNNGDGRSKGMTKGELKAKGLTSKIVEMAVAGAPGNNTASGPGMGSDTTLKTRKARLFKDIYRRHGTKKDQTKIGVK